MALRLIERKVMEMNANQMYSLLDNLNEQLENAIVARDGDKQAALTSEIMRLERATAAIEKDKQTKKANKAEKAVVVAVEEVVEAPAVVAAVVETVEVPVAVEIVLPVVEVVEAPAVAEPVVETPAVTEPIVETVADRVAGMTKAERHAAQVAKTKAIFAAQKAIKALEAKPAPVVIEKPVVAKSPKADRKAKFERKINAPKPVVSAPAPVEVHVVPAPVAVKPVLTSTDLLTMLGDAAKQLSSMVESINHEAEARVALVNEGTKVYEQVNAVEAMIAKIEAGLNGLPTLIRPEIEKKVGSQLSQLKNIARIGHSDPLYRVGALSAVKMETHVSFRPITLKESIVEKQYKQETAPKQAPKASKKVVREETNDRYAGPEQMFMDSYSGKEKPLYEIVSLSCKTQGMTPKEKEAQFGDVASFIVNSTFGFELTVSQKKQVADRVFACRRDHFNKNGSK